MESRKPRRPTVSGTPFSAKASRIVRAFLSEPSREWAQSEMVQSTGVTQGYASKCLKMLHEHHGPAYTGAHGITIYHPEVDWTTDSDNTYYRTLGFTLVTSWDEFLDAWHAGSVGKAPDRSYPTRRSLQADGRAPPSSITAAHSHRSTQ